jgi:serine/threonine protein kinase
MLKGFIIPASFSLINKGKVLLLLKEEYKDHLLGLGIEGPEDFPKKSHGTTFHLGGRRPHPSIPMTGGKRVVFRSYSHGGLFRAFTRNLYLFGSRSFQELALTEEIRSCGIPTLQPLGAIQRFVFFRFYEAYFLSLEIPHAMDLVQFFQRIGPHPTPQDLILKRKMIRSAALLLRQFHQSGVFHGDLQLKNILVSGDQPLIIDFDRSYRKPGLSAKERAKNLFRLNRSAEKWRHLGLPVTRTDLWRFLGAYTDDDPGILKLMRRKLRTYPIRIFVYRIGWMLEGILRGKSSELLVRSSDQ